VISSAMNVGRALSQSRRESVLDGYKLDAEERGLLKRREIRALHDRGGQSVVVTAGAWTRTQTHEDYASAMNLGKSRGEE
jgi:hypothetical protein